ncbi:hypothetical protein NDU88_006452 [Pleurodeles waltl]|uniref:Uncharacterized protein n=1 Tax=Pleurodeles waltl TaxID=8319 RepID=A0AAV7RR90_PLEWA|nr:hypothetical protein NDU88_006452 [Pleurodeles waltl]
MASRLSPGRGPRPCTVHMRLLSAPRAGITAAPHSPLPPGAVIRGCRRYCWAGAQPSAPSLSSGPETRPGRQHQQRVASLLLPPPEQARPWGPPRRHSGHPFCPPGNVRALRHSRSPHGRGPGPPHCYFWPRWRSSETRVRLLRHLGHAPSGAV